jgi:predicted DNA-binding transcriptional regulator YafY
MAQNKNALIRYKTIDKCLQNGYRRWTLEDLIEACSEALYEYEGKDVNVSKRTVQLDIQLMRSDKLGYNAPIVSYEKKYYKYAEEGYSITNIPITENDINVLSETVDMLKQFKDFSLFLELGGIIQKLEDKVYTEKTKTASVIHLDKNENLKVLNYLDELYQAIIKKIVLKIKYKSFKARDASEFTFHPFLLKEFNNRWFIVGRKSKDEPITNLALDRIKKIDFDLDVSYIDEAFDGDSFYANTIGATVMSEDIIKTVVFKVDRKNVPYVLTKPFHSSQKTVEKHKDGSITFEIRVHLNYELERIILGFGDALEVLSPKRLRRTIRKKFKNGMKMYKED